MDYFNFMTDITRCQRDFMFWRCPRCHRSLEPGEIGFPCPYCGEGGEDEED